MLTNYVKYVIILLRNGYQGISNSRGGLNETKLYFRISK